MAAIDFPNSPTLNQIYTSGDKSWKWDGTVWNSVTKTIQGDPGRFYTSDTAPTFPTLGDGWFNTTNGKMYIFYDNFWVDAAQSIFTSNVTDASAINSGLVSTGTQTFAGDKTFSGNIVAANYPLTGVGSTLILNQPFSNTGFIHADSLFTSDSDSYFVQLVITSASGACDVFLQLRSGGTTNSTAYAYSLFSLMYGNTVASISGGPSIGYTHIGRTGAGGTLIQFSLQNPNLALPTIGNTMSMDLDGFSRVGGFWHNVSSAFDGIRISLSSAQTINGSLRVYKVKK